MDVAVVEAGLGGRHDATNVLRTRVVVLTNVALDHMEVLGDTREAIAAEKLAVVQPGATVVLGEPEWQALAEAERRRRRSSLTSPSNLALAIAAAEAFLGDSVGARRRRRTSTLPGRLERRGERPLEIWDGAHNLAGVAYLLPRLPEREYVLVSSILEDKRPGADARGALGARAGAGRHASRRIPAPCPQGNSLPAPNGTSTMSRPSSIRPRHGAAHWPWRAQTGPSSSRAPSIFLATSVAPARPHTVGEKVSVFALAAFVLVAIVGGAFAAGYLIGRMLL